MAEHHRTINRLVEEQTKCQRPRPHHILHQLRRIYYWHLRPRKRPLLPLWLYFEAEVCTKCSDDGRRGLCTQEGYIRLKNWRKNFFDIQFISMFVAEMHAVTTTVSVQSSARNEKKGCIILLLFHSNIKTFYWNYWLTLQYSTGCLRRKIANLMCQYKKIKLGICFITSE